MSVDLQTVRSEFVGTGAPAVYASQIYAKSSDQIFVFEDGAPKAYGTHYTLTGIGTATGVDVHGTFINGAEIVVRRDTLITQEIDVRNNETLLEEVLETGLDRRTMVEQELAYHINSSIRVDNGPIAAIPGKAADRSLMFVRFSDGGEAVDILSEAELATIFLGITKGDPGGNIMAIGLFLGAAALNIPVGTNVVRTAGYSVNGIGIADYVADAAVDAAYVLAHQRTSFISANARGFRLDVSKGVDLFQVGGIADCTATGVGTDNYLALKAAYDSLNEQGGEIRVPFGRFRIGSTLVLTKRVTILGAGWGENPGLVNGVPFPIPRNYSGSMLMFDADTAGMRFIAYHDNTLGAPAFEFQSSRQSCLRDLFLYGGSGILATSHGLEMRSQVYCDNVRVENFAGTGFYYRSSTFAGDLYGNTNFVNVFNCHSILNKLHGFHIYGSDANVMSFIGCNSALNGGVAYLDAGALGNNYYSCHSATNNQSFGTPAGYTAAQRAQVMADAPELADAQAGSFFTRSDVSPNVYSGCYVEVGLGHKHCIIRPSIIMLGNLASYLDDVVDILSDFRPITFNAGEVRNLQIFKTNGNGFTFDDDLLIDGTRVVTNRQPIGILAGGVVGGATQDAECRAATNAIINILTVHGLIG